LQQLTRGIAHDVHEDVTMLVFSYLGDTASQVVGLTYKSHAACCVDSTGNLHDGAVSQEGSVMYKHGEDVKASLDLAFHTRGATCSQNGRSLSHQIGRCEL